ncbi:alpha/beta fold hydrolase [Burkholderia gladioli]|uniref:alpha/beta hydrolase n=1 Tax=Burkholderia gladioli TaxID=28095 RepID=UPI00264B3F37|nr:alpha/beta fold hydrolase [Burkholderia gladioli]MDN7599260.1 alpha/beta fold hydrolase [Burkholderia gladioli]
MVHGGCQAAWCWALYAPLLAQAGFDVHALNWRGRGGSAALDTADFVSMSIADVVDDIRCVALELEAAPILVGHSMGGLAAQLYAARYPVRALVALTPVVPSNVGAEPVALPIADMAAPWGPPPLEATRELFFQGLTDAECRRYQAMLVPESPRRVREATQWSLPIEVDQLSAPTLVISGALDILTPPATGAALAGLYGCEHWLEPAHGHNVLLGEGAAGIARRLIDWLQGRA